MELNLLEPESPSLPLIIHVSRLFIIHQEQLNAVMDISTGFLMTTPSNRTPQSGHEP